VVANWRRGPTIIYAMSTGTLEWVQIVTKETKDGAMDGLAGPSIAPWTVRYGGPTVTRGDQL